MCARMYAATHEHVRTCMPAHTHAHTPYTRALHTRPRTCARAQTSTCIDTRERTPVRASLQAIKSGEHLLAIQQSKAQATARVAADNAAAIAAVIKARMGLA
eukprot:6196341-Pleurochrysis_carterae.AAC.4